MTQTNAAVTFLPEAVTSKELVLDESGRPAMLIDGIEVPVMEADPSNPEGSVLYRVDIIQPGKVKNNKDLAPHVGKFYLDDFKDSYAELTLLPVGVRRKGRRKFPPYGSGEKGLLCYSNDGLVPSPKVELPPAEVCAEWTQGKRGGTYLKVVCADGCWGENGEKPSCSDFVEVVFLAVMEPDMVVPISLQFSGTGMSAWKNFLKDFTKQKNTMRFQKRCITTLAVKATLVNEGTYFQLKFDFFEPEDFKPKEYVPLAHHYQELLIRNYEEPEEALVDPSASGDLEGVTLDSDSGEEEELDSGSDMDI